MKNLILKAHANLSMVKFTMKEKLTLDKKGISTLVEVAGVLAIIVAAIILVMPQATAAISGIWSSVTTNAKNFFSSSTAG